MTVLAIVVAVLTIACASVVAWLREPSCNCDHCQCDCAKCRLPGTNRGRCGPPDDKLLTSGDAACVRRLHNCPGAPSLGDRCKSDESQV